MATLNLKLVVLLSLPLTFGLLISTCIAQTPATTVKATAKIVGFRALEWKTLQSNSNQQAQQTISTLKKLGCEVKTADRKDGVDISFRCVDWRSMKLDTDTLVKQWATWCGAQGMETVTINPPAKTNLPTVKFRMVKPKSVQLVDMEKAKKIVNTLTLIGCKVETADQNGHFDCTFSAPQWTTLELQTEDIAHAWIKWLDESGFETEHQHVR